MMIDDETAVARAWALPAISALMILHHDFSPPRLAQIRQLVWSGSSLEVLLQYGICNSSGTIIDAADLRITLNREGTVGVYTREDHTSEKKRNLVRFLAGEISRETVRWREDLAAWSQDNPTLPPARAAILNIVSALLACQNTSLDIHVEKALDNRGDVVKIRIRSGTDMIDIRSAGTRCANLCTHSINTQKRTVLTYNKYDTPIAARVLQMTYLRLLNKALFTAVQLALLPIEFFLFLCEQINRRDASVMLCVDTSAPAVVDASAGDSLSALFS